MKSFLISILSVSLVAVALYFAVPLYAETDMATASNLPATVSAPAAEEAIHLTKADFLKRVFDYEKSPNKWVYAGDKPCIVDFYADWCGPCKQVAPIMEDLAKTYKGKIYVYKINTDKEKELAAKFNIRSIPTVLFCPKYGQPQMAQGALSKNDYDNLVRQVLLNGKPQK